MPKLATAAAATAAMTDNTAMRHRMRASCATTKAIVTWTAREGKTRSGPSPETRVSPGRALERQMIVLVGIGDAEIVGHHVKKRHVGNFDKRGAVVGAELEHRLVASGRERYRQRRMVERALG